jgi:phytoene/squalene synthetase
MNGGIEAFRSQLQKELGLSIGPKDPLLALWVSQRELLEQNAAQQQKLLSEFQAALGKSQTAWSEQAKALAQQSLNAGLQAAQNSTALLLEEAARMNRAAVRKAAYPSLWRRSKRVLAGWSKRWRPAGGSPG